MKSPLFRQWVLLRAVTASEGRATVKSLKKDTGVSEKTIRRDLELLRRVGFPIVESVGEFGRKTYALQTRDLPQLRFTYEEGLALFFCRRAMAAWEGSFFWEGAQQAFQKIQASLGEKVAQYVERLLPRIASVGSLGNNAEKAELINQLLMAIEVNKTVFITYQSARSTEPLTYDVYPYGIADHQGTLYFVGFSLQHDEVRHWKLDRMIDAEATRVPAQRPADFDLREHFRKSFGVFHGGDEISVQIRFSPSAARYVQEKRKHASQKVTLESDGSALVEFQVPQTPELKSWILSFGPSAEVLSPAALCTEIEADLQQMTELYRTQPKHSRKSATGQSTGFTPPVSAQPRNKRKGPST